MIRAVLAALLLVVLVAGVALAQEVVRAGAPTAEGGVPWAIAGPVGGALAAVVAVLFWQLRAETAGRLADAHRYADAQGKVQSAIEKLTLLADTLTRRRP